MSETSWKQATDINRNKIQYRPNGSKLVYAERIACFLCMHLGAYRFFTHPTAGAYSLQIYDSLSQIQRVTKVFLLIVRHNTEGPPISDWQWSHRRLFFFVGLQNPVNLVLFFKTWCDVSKFCDSVHIIIIWE